MRALIKGLIARRLGVFPMLHCEHCTKEHDGSYGSGRFCSESCAHYKAGFMGGQAPRVSAKVKIAICKKVLAMYRTGAKERGLIWALPFEQFCALLFQNCFYCGIAPSTPASVLLRNGVDRVDNTRDYAPDNCVTACKVCNNAKSTLTKEEFLSWIRRTHEYQSQALCKTAGIGK